VNRIDADLISLSGLQDSGRAIISRVEKKIEIVPRHFLPFGKVCLQGGDCDDVPRATGH
jgi:hypothetical protein